MNSKTATGLLLASVIVAFLGIQPLQAQLRTADEAQRLADQFWPLKRGGENPSKQIVFTEQDSVDHHPYFYIFNRGDNQGFIIISADERSQKILGYSDTGSFDPDDVPSEMRAWLRIYQRELKDLSLTPDSLLQMDLGQMVLSKGRAKGSQSFATAVAPLLGDINYSQSHPYNALCPVISGQPSVTGCVATAAVQVMRYWQHPKQPTGKSHSYLLYGQPIGTTFSTTYDWAHMLSHYDTYTGDQQQQQAVARLMADAGIACDMEYTPQESGAVTQNMAKGLIDYFGYDMGATIFQRADFTQADFVYYLKRELNAGRPVLVSGSGSGGGHCFVCDGYDANGMFHINWGWNGKSNGYFQITNLNPASLGIGGGSGGGFNDEVLFVGGIQPPCTGSRPVYVLSFREMSAPLSFGLGKKVKVQLRHVSNASLYDYNGEVGVGLYRDGQLCQVLGSTKIALKPGYFFNTMTVSAKLPSKLAAGSYQLVVVCKSGNDNQWRACLNNNCNCIDLTIAGKSVTGEFNPSTHYCDLPDNGFDRMATTETTTTTTTTSHAQPTTATSSGLRLTRAISFTDNQHVTNGNQTLTAQLIADSDYSGKVGAFIYDGSLQHCLATLQAGTVGLPGGQESRCTFSGVLSLTPGNYFVSLFYIDGNNGWKQVPQNDLSCMPFTLVEGSSLPHVAAGGNVRPGEEGGFEDDAYTSSTVTASHNALLFSNVPLDDHFYDDDDSESFEQFGEEVFAKAVDDKAPFTCQALRFTKADTDFIDDRMVYVFSLGSATKLEYTLVNKHDTPQTHILTLSLYDKNDRWVADLAERQVTVGAKDQLKGQLPIRFVDVAPGAYKMRLTEAANSSAVSRPVAPAAASSLFVSIKRPESTPSEKAEQ